MARGGIGLTVGYSKFLSDADLGNMTGGSQGASHHCVSVLYLDWVCGTHAFISVELGRMMDLGVQKTRAHSIPRAASQAAEGINIRALQEDPRPL